jgi:RimJ/RimL family protein N-acetyltransferase
MGTSSKVTPQIEFRKLDISNVLEMFELWSDYDAVKLTNWPYVSSLEECKERLVRVIEHYSLEPRHFGPYTIQTIDGQFSGIIGADASDTLPGHYEVWYFVSRKQWRKGIGTAALAELLERIAASGQGASVAFATAVCDNLPSLGLLEKLGFQRQERIPKGHQKHGLAVDVFKYTRAVGSSV